MKAFIKKYSLQLTLLVFGLIYSSISLVNHYNFRTFAYDLGLMNNAIYDYAHFRWNDCMLMQPQFKNILEDHFTLLQILFSPLYYLFGTYTMLIVQICCILLGGYGIYRYFREKNSHAFSLLAMVHFFTCWGVFSAVGFDYHDNVIAAMFVPWLFYFFRKEQWKPAFLMVVLILISKENMSLWMFFIGAGLALDSFRNTRKVKMALGYMLLSAAYFYVVVNWVMPSLAVEQRGYLHFKYEALGHNFSEAFRFILQHPIDTIGLLFRNQLNDPTYDGIKAELHLMVIVSGGFCFLFRPQYLVMLIPIYAQKMFNDNYDKWGINNHYSIEFVPILSILLFTVLATVKKETLRQRLAMAALALSFFFSMSKIDHRVSKWYDGVMLRFYSPDHYRNNFDVALAHRVLKSLIPENAIVSAHHQVVPHLAFRDYIYKYPDVLNAEYIILLETQNPYPLPPEEFVKMEKEYLSNPQWTTIYHHNTMLILKRN